MATTPLLANKSQTFRARFYGQVDRKLTSYAKNDIIRMGRSDPFSLAEGVNMIAAANGRCVVCDKQLKLASWTPGCRDQFSFDRIDDGKPHSPTNCRVTCLGCNLDKAVRDYQPTELFPRYEAVKKMYFKLRSYSEFVGLSPEMLLDLYRIEGTLHLMQPRAFGVEKKNNWKPRGVPFPEGEEVEQTRAVCRAHGVEL